MLLNNDPRDTGTYPIACLSILKPNKPYKEIIAEPRRFNHKWGSGFSLLIGGMFFLFYLEHSFSESELGKYSINPNKTMTVIEVENDGLDWIMSYFGMSK